MQFDIPEYKNKIRILTIEDEELLREYICDFLEDLGFTTLQASNGRIGIELFRKEKPDLVLTDLRMPEMNGLDVLAVMQKEFPETPVIVISGTGSLNDVVQTLKFGAWDYILKPIYDCNILEMAINRVLERKHLIMENRRYKEHLEEEVAKRTDELVKSTQRFKTLFNLAGDGIFIHDLQGKIVDFNQQAIEYSGYSGDQLLQMTMQQIFHPSEAAKVAHSFQVLPEKLKIMFESQHQHQNLTSIPVEVNASVITMDSSPQVLAICRDITERKKAQDEREQMEKQIMTAQKMESIGLLASGIAHDFNNVLFALTGYTTLLHNKMRHGSRESEYIEKINEIINMGQTITNRITTFIRKEKEELVEVDIHKTLLDTEALLRPNCRNIEVKLDLKADQHLILGDEGQLQNAFLNLGINARDAMPSGGMLLFATNLTSGVDEHSETPHLCISVTDTGVGMNKDTLAKIYDPLFTTKERGKGTGLGLTSVMYCIKNLHGKIEAQSTVGQGTTFRIYLPLVNKNINSDETQENISMSGKMIQIITQEKAVAEAIGKRFSLIGLTTQIHSDFVSAIEWLKINKESVTMIFLDYYMPLLKETDAMGDLQSIESQIPVVMISGKDNMSLRYVDSWSAENNSVSMPLNSDQFFDVVTTLMGKRQQKS